MTATRLCEIGSDAWPDELGFIPFVGPEYEAGIDGSRVLLLGESHYREDGAENSPGITRPFTNETFGDRILPVRNGGDGRFFAPIDRVLTGSTSPSPTEAAAAWKRVAFSNLVQEFAGERAGERPSPRQFNEGSVRILKAFEILRPDVILVLGREAWKGFDAGFHRNDLPSFFAEVGTRYHREREVWELRYPGGSALMTWVYHPSYNIDGWHSGARALRHLLRLKAAEVGGAGAEQAVTAAPGLSESFVDG